MTRKISDLAQKIANYVEAQWPIALEDIYFFLRIDDSILSDKQISDALYELTQEKIIHTQVNAKEHAKSLVVPRRFSYLY